MFEQTFKNIDDMLRKDAGCSSELDYVEQTSWIIFLKCLDDFEQERQNRAGLECDPVLKPEFQSWIQVVSANFAGLRKE